jgi:protein phosphatase
MRRITLPYLSLVALVGVSGAGKSTFAQKHFGRYEVLSSDTFRGMVSDDENSQDATVAAFDALHHVAGLRLDAGRLTVVDATNVTREARRSLVELARAHDVLPVAVVLDVPVKEAVRRNASRPDRDFGERVVRRHHDLLRRSLRGLAREGFRRVHVLTGEDIDEVEVVREPLLTDKRDQHGPFDVVGDVHGCLPELLTLLDRLGYRVVRDEQGRAVDAVPPQDRRAVFVGDLVDRGPDSPGVLRLVMGMHAAGHALVVPGNHEHKLVRALDGRKVTVSHGLETTLAQLEAEPEELRTQVRDW